MKLRSVKKLLNLQPDSLHNYYNTEIHAQNTSKYYFIPLPHTIFKHWGLHPEHMGGSDVMLKVYFAASLGLTGAVASIRLDEIAVVFQTNNLVREEKMAMAAIHDSARVMNFLRVQQLQDSGSTWTAGSTFQYTLEQLQGKVSHLIFRVNTSQTNGSQLQNVKLPDNATISLQDPTGQDLLYSGSPTMLRSLNQHFLSDQFNNHDFVVDSNWYVVPICRDIAASFVGKFNGWISITGSKHRLAIALPAAGTTCQQTIDHTNTPTSGYFRLAFRGAVTDALAYNASTSAIATAFNALKTAKEYPGGPLTIAASQAASAGDIVLTFSQVSNPYVQVNDLVQLVSESTTAASPTYASASITQYAADGWATGTYYFTCYAAMLCQLKANGKGGYRADDLQ